MCPDTDSTEDFIASIADCLKGRFERRQITEVIKDQIMRLPELGPNPFWGRQDTNKRYAKEIGDIVKELTLKLKGAPEETRMAIFTVSVYPPNTPNAIDMNIVSYYQSRLLLFLEMMRNGCKAFGLNKIGDHHNVDYPKQLCANLALQLIVGMEAGKPSNAGKDSPLRVIANFLFEAAYPQLSAEWRAKHKANADLRLQCDNALKRWKKMTEPQRGAFRQEIQSGLGLTR